VVGRQNVFSQEPMNLRLVFAQPNWYLLERTTLRCVVVLEYQQGEWFVVRI